MKRKLLTAVSLMMLVVALSAVNSFAFNTTSSEYVGSVTNNTGGGGTAWGRLSTSGGRARLEIRNPGSTKPLATGIYPANPQNPNDTTCSCPNGTTREFYAISDNGNQTWGSAYYGLS